MEWLRRLRRRWRRAGGDGLFRRLCRAERPSERRRLGMRIERRVLPPDMLGWSRYFLAVIRALAGRGAEEDVGPLDERFNWFFKEFAVTFPGLVPNNLSPGELSAFAIRAARRVPPAAAGG